MQQIETACCVIHGDRHSHFNSSLLVRLHDWFSERYLLSLRKPKAQPRFRIRMRRFWKKWFPVSFQITKIGNSCWFFSYFFLTSHILSLVSYS